MKIEGLNYIDGNWVGKESKRREVRNPATGEIIGTVPVLGKKETNAAIDAAYHAFPLWSGLPARQRSGYLMKLYELMLKNKEQLAKIITSEMGKPIKEARGEVQYAADFIEWYAEEGKRVYGRIVPGKNENHRIQVLKQPVGVVAAITTWNFPAAMLTRKLGPALAAGCTIVIKPAKQSPFTAIKLMELCEESGFPRGVVNLVTGEASEIGDAFMENSKVRKVTFTGSTEVGKILIQQSASQVKKLSLELGGHAPLIVFDDADLEKAIKGAVDSKFRNAGQTCISTNRIYVQSGIYDRFVDRFAEEVRRLRVGDGFDEKTDIGPIIDGKGFEKIRQHIDDAFDKGAEVITSEDDTNKTRNVYFISPTILKNVTSDMQVMQEETFGPVAPVKKFETDEEAIEMANHTPFGLAAYIFTESLSRGTRAVEKMKFGIIGWNDGLPSAAQAPFGGMKQSGIGREGGQEGIEGYLETKYVSLGI